MTNFLLIVGILVVIADLLQRYFDTRLIQDQRRTIEQQAKLISNLKALDQDRERSIYIAKAARNYWRDRAREYLQLIRARNQQDWLQLTPVQNTIVLIDEVDWN